MGRCLPVLKLVCGCVRKGERVEKKKKASKDETVRVKDWEDGFFFFFQERDDRWREGSDETGERGEGG